MNTPTRAAFVTAMLVSISFAGCAGVSSDEASPSRAHLPPAINYELISADEPPPRIEWTNSLDFGELRELYGRRRDFGERCEHPPEREALMEAARDGRPEDVLALTDSLLSRCPVDPLLHHLRASALEESGLSQDAEIHRRWVVGIFDSILASGDGKTKNTPFVTISIAEEYYLLEYLGLTRKSQSLVQGPVAMDLIVAEREDGNEVVVYFNPALHFVRLYEAFK
jgi:hypothetical protein